MWLLEFLFIMVTLMIGWTLFGYLIFMCFVGLFRKKKEPVFPQEWPVISIIIPCYNEESDILEKLDDVRKLDYPKDRMEVFFVDGGSSDRTVEMLNGAFGRDGFFQILMCPEKGKISQLNYALSHLKGDIVVNTDVDSRLAPDALKWIAAEFAASPEVWVVGAYCRPVEALEVEQYYWATQNKGRFLETDAGSSSIVIAQCYAFRRELIKAFPEDVVADDIYVAFLANSTQHRTVYSRYATAVETRVPKSYSEFLPHKFRKSNAFLRESLRFMYLLPDMRSFNKVMFITRIAQQLLLPWMALFWVLIAGILMTIFRFDLVVLGILFLLVMLALTSRVFAWVKLPDGIRHFSFMTMVKGYLLTTLITLATGSSYIFYRQGSSYSRLKHF